MKLQGWRLTFELCCAGVDMHPFLAFSTTHQETGHRLTWKKCVGLCNLTTKRERGKESANILREIKQTEKLKRGSIMTKIVYLCSELPTEDTFKYIISVPATWRLFTYKAAAFAGCREQGSILNFRNIHFPTRDSINATQKYTNSCLFCNASVFFSFPSYLWSLSVTVSSLFCSCFLLQQAFCVRPSHREGDGAVGMAGPPPSPL